MTERPQDHDPQHERTRPARLHSDADDFDAALRARSRLLPRFDESSDDEPSPEIDRLVLARARDALRRETPTELHYRGPRWAVPVALAATVLLSLGLVMQMDTTRDDLVLPQPVSAPQAVGGSDAEYGAYVESDLAAAPAAPPVTPPAPAAPNPAAPPRAPRAMAAVGDAEPDARSAAGTAARESTLSSASVGTLRNRASGAATAPAAMRSEAAASTALTHDDPQRWLEGIERLRRAGEIETARRELAAFVDQHPDLPLPAALQLLR